MNRKLKTLGPCTVYDFNKNIEYRGDYKIKTFELQNCTVNGCDFYKFFSFSEDLDAREFIGTYVRNSRCSMVALKPNT